MRFKSLKTVTHEKSPEFILFGFAVKCTVIFGGKITSWDEAEMNRVIQKLIRQKFDSTF